MPAPSIAPEPPPQPLDAAIIQSAYPKPPPIQLLESTDSTNTQVMQMLQAKAETQTAACAADYQRAGRGRSGRTWVSPPGHNVMLSVGRRLPLEALRHSGLSLAAGVESCRALADNGANDIGLKWPNDLMLYGATLQAAKLGGILVESNSMAGEDCVYIVIGVGINLYLPPDIRRQIERDARAQRTAQLPHIDRNLLIGTLAGRLNQLLTHWPQTGLHPYREEYDRLLLWKGSTVELSGEQLPKKLRGQFSGIDEQGALLLVTDGNKSHRFQAGEVSLRPLEE